MSKIANSVPQKFYFSPCNLNVAIIIQVGFSIMKIAKETIMYQYLKK